MHVSVFFNVFPNYQKNFFCGNWIPPLLPAEIKPDPPLYYWPEVNDYTMSCGIAETPGGRIWLAWFPGGYDAWEVLLMAKSDDGGDLRTAIYH